jgi:hypothetical protein
VALESWVEWRLESVATLFFVVVLFLFVVFVPLEG